MTRAKENLHIHYNQNLLDDFVSENIDFRQKWKPFIRNQEFLTLQLAMKDVFLDFFQVETKFDSVLSKRNYAFVAGKYLYARTQEGFIPVLQFSKKCWEQIQNVIRQGYQPFRAEVHFIIAWKGKKLQKNLPFFCQICVSGGYHERTIRNYRNFTEYCGIPSGKIYTDTPEFHLWR